MNNLLTFLHTALGVGVDSEKLLFGQMAARAALIFVSALIMVRLGDKRFFAKNTAFDIILGFTLASVLARAINGSAPLLPTIATGFLLVELHRLFAWLAFHSDWFGDLIKGTLKS